MSKHQNPHHLDQPRKVFVFLIVPARNDVFSPLDAQGFSPLDAQGVAN